MADQELRIKAIIDDVDDSKLQQKLSSYQSNVNKTLSGSGSGSSGSKSVLAQQVSQVDKLQERLKLLSDVQSKLAGQPGMERNLAKVNQELANVYSRYKNLSSNSNAYLQNLEKEVALRKQATQLTTEANKNEGVYSAHSERQFAMLQQIAGQVPGGGIINRFLGGARATAIRSAESGGSGSLLSGGAIAGGAAAATFAAVGVAAGAMVSKLNEFISSANQLSQSASNASSSLGQLRSQLEKESVSQTIGASSPGVTGAAQAKSWIGQQWDNFVTNAFNSPEQVKQGINSSIQQGLGGDDKETWRRIKEHGQDINIDLARQRQSLDIQQQRQVRDFNLEQKSWQIDIANQKFDLQKQAQRNEQDYTIAKQQFDENHAGVMAKKEFDLQQKYATQAYQIQQQRAQQDFSLQQQYKAQDYSISRNRAQQDFSISRSDKAYDFNLSQGRNQQEFNISQSRNLTSRSNQLMDMALGGATGLQYLQSARDFSLQQRYAKEDFERQKQYATQDYQIGQSRDLRNFNISQGRAAQDYQKGVARDTQQFGISQGRAAQDFSISRQQAQDQRNLQIEDMLYQRKYEGISLELQHNRNLQDSSIAFQRLNQAVGLQAERFGNQASDINVDQALQNRDFNITAYRTLRDYGYQQQDFAGAMRDKNPLGAYGQSLQDPTFAAASARYAQATGRQPLADQVNAAIDDSINGFGATMAKLMNNPLSLFGSGSNDKLKGIGGPNITFSPQHNVTFPTVGGASEADLQDLQRKMDTYMQALKALDSAFGTTTNYLAGGTGPGFPMFLG